MTLAFDILHASRLHGLIATSHPPLLCERGGSCGAQPPRLTPFAAEQPLPHKQLFFRSEARENILRGATALADAVRVNARPHVEVCDDRAEVG